jgi:flagellar basal-body rod protein FlgG
MAQALLPRRRREDLSVNAGLYSAVSGSVLAQTRLDAITNNLANASTPGFKAERLVQRAEQVGTAPSAPAVSTPVTRGHLETDFSQGPIAPTGNPLDVALSGDGFLVVDGAHGERLTRRGNFAVDGDGFLTTSDGLRVQGENGDLNVGRGPVAITPDGGVRAGNAAVGKLRVVKVTDPAALVREGGTMFAPGTQRPVAVAPGEVEVVQGSLEGATLSPVENLVALIDTMRGFEAYMRAAERLDQVTGRAISDVGRV